MRDLPQNSRGVDIRLDRLTGSNSSALRTAAPERMQIVGLSLGVIVKFSQPSPISLSRAKGSKAGVSEP